MCSKCLREHDLAEESLYGIILVVEVEKPQPPILYQCTCYFCLRHLNPLSQYIVLLRTLDE